MKNGFNEQVFSLQTKPTIEAFICIVHPIYILAYNFFLLSFKFPRPLKPLQPLNSSPFSSFPDLQACFQFEAFNVLNSMMIIQSRTYIYIHEHIALSMNFNKRVVIHSLRALTNVLCHLLPLQNARKSISTLSPFHIKIKKKLIKLINLKQVN